MGKKPRSMPARTAPHLPPPPTGQYCPDIGPERRHVPPRGQWEPARAARTGYPGRRRRPARSLLPAVDGARGHLECPGVTLRRPGLGTEGTAPGVGWPFSSQSSWDRSGSPTRRSGRCLRSRPPGVWRGTRASTPPGFVSPCRLSPPGLGEHPRLSAPGGGMLHLPTLNGLSPSDKCSEGSPK